MVVSVFGLIFGLYFKIGVGTYVSNILGCFNVQGCNVRGKKLLGVEMSEISNFGFVKL